MRISDWSSDVCSSDLVVRLAEGDMNRATIYSDDPAAQAELFHKQKATHLHVVDLDGALAGHAVNAGAVESILKSFDGKVQLGGGIRDMKAVEHWLGLGVHRVVIGHAALENPELVRQVAHNYPVRIVVTVVATEPERDV